MALQRGHAGPRRALTIITLLAVMGIFGWPFTTFVTHHGEQLQRMNLNALASTAGASLDPEHVAALTGRPEDVDSANFRLILARLVRIRAVNPDARFVYLVRQTDGKIIFLADAEPPDSKDYSAPGDVYADAPEGLRHVLAQGRHLVVGPYQDVWGEWVTGFEPIADPKTGKPIAALGIDIAAGQWRTAVTAYRNFGIAIGLLVSSIVALLVFGLLLQSHHSAGTRELNERLMTELSERKRIERTLRLDAAIFRSTSDGIIVTDASGTIQTVNPAFEKVTGFTQKEAVGKNPRILKSGRHDPDFYAAVWKDLAERGQWIGEFWNRRKDGDEYLQETNINCIRDENGHVVQYAAICRDVTERRKMEEMLRQLSTMDGLTGLANRRTFDEALQTEWSRSMREARRVTLMLLDIDFFKRFNDTYGHWNGDQCLQQVANVLKGHARRAADLAARYGGEEFALILPGLEASAASSVAQQIRRDVEQLKIPNEQSEAGDVVTVSIGIVTVTPGRGTPCKLLIELADHALYRAKYEGRNRVAVG